jgi:peptidoglycan/LPS O-acetylase OafA/YrhL
MRDTRTSDRLIALFLLGVLAISPPLLAVFRVDAFIADMPVLFFYLFAAWAVLVGFLALIIEARRAEMPEPPPED